MTEIELRTRYRIVFLYRELRKGKCVDTPLYYKLSGAVDGDAFEHYKAFAKEVYDSLPKKCIIGKDELGGSGVCIVTYIFKGKFIYHKKIYHVFTIRKDGAKIAFKVDAKTGKKKQVNYRAALKNDRAQGRREKIARKKYKMAKKKVIKQFQMYQGCYSPDMAYKGR